MKKGILLVLQSLARSIISEKRKKKKKKKKEIFYSIIQNLIKIPEIRIEINISSID
jgi:hypothetical protein